MTLPSLGNGPGLRPEQKTLAQTRDAVSLEHELFLAALDLEHGSSVRWSSSVLRAVWRWVFSEAAFRSISWRDALLRINHSFPPGGKNGGGEPRFV